MRLNCRARTLKSAKRPCLWLFSILIAVFAAPLAKADEEQVTYYYTDAQGNVLGEMDAIGSETARTSYGPYGEPIVGNPAPGPGFAGHMTDPTPGLVYMQQRYYDPVIGRFLSVDPVQPIPGELRHFNRYEYGYGNPYRYPDPDGACPACILVAVSLLTASDFANAPGPGDRTVSMSPAERLEVVTGALPANRGISAVRSVIHASDALSQRAATREAKRQVGIPTSQQASSQSNGSIDGNKVGRQQLFQVPKEQGGTETKVVQVSRDIRGDHAGMSQVEAGTAKPLGQLDPGGRTRILNDTKVRIDFDPNL